MRAKILIAIFVGIICVALTDTSAQGAPITYHWVSTTGSSGWSTCVGETDPGSNYCSLATANSNLAAGQTVYLKAGTYNNDGYINPANSGTAGNYITYEAQGGTVTISGQAYGVYLVNKNYIKVSGISVASSTTQPLLISNGNYNIIYNSTFYNGTGDWWGSEIMNNSTYNWINGCTFYQRGSTDQGAVLNIGTEDSDSDATRYNLIENCTMYWGAHHVMGIMGRYNTVRNNFVHNEAWNPYGHRNIYLYGTTNNIRNIFEGNRIGYAGISADGGVNHGMLLASNYNIVRYNQFLRNTGAGVGLDTGGNYSVAPSYNAVYNNTFYGNSAAGDRDGGGVDFNDWGHPGAITGNLFKNNLFYANGSPVLSFRNYGGVTLGNQTFVNNFNGTNGQNANPLFVNSSGTDPANPDVPDLHLQATSTARDFGAALTTVAVADTGSGTALIVSDAKYFQDGTFAPPGTVNADWIAVGTVSNRVQISSINYSTNTITLANSITRSDGNSVWLYKKSDGVVVLAGSQPDAGAQEYMESPVISPPRGLRTESLP